MHNAIKSGLLGLVVTLAPAASTVFADEGGAADNPSREAPMPPAYPSWPERPMRDDIPPPPPGGPYMSTGLDDIGKFPRGDGLRYEQAESTMRSPFFEPEMPWPETPDAGPPRRWKPESGEYNFAPEGLAESLDRKLERHQHRAQSVVTQGGLPQSGRPMAPPRPLPPPGYYQPYRGGW